jgi:Phosphatase-1 catalytic subunit binding region
LFFFVFYAILKSVCCIQVSFDEATPAQIPVLNESQWTEDYRNARTSFWEELARDRCRFQRRITETAGKIEWIFKPEHRDKIISKTLSE